MDSGTVVNIIGDEDTETSDSVPLTKSSADESIDQQKTQKIQKKKKYVKTVLLTFAQDGYDLAKRIAQQIRSLDLGIGVLILEEHRDEVETCGDSIFRWFHEVIFQ